MYKLKSDLSNVVSICNYHVLHFPDNPDLSLYRQNFADELSRNKQFAFTNIVRTNKLRPPIHLVNTEPCAYEHFNKLISTDLMLYLTEKNKFIVRTFNLHTFLIWRLPVY
jgi:hypothetical protein